MYIRRSFRVLLSARSLVRGRAAVPQISQVKAHLLTGDCPGKAAGRGKPKVRKAAAPVDPTAVFPGQAAVEPQAVRVDECNLGFSARVVGKRVPPFLIPGTRPADFPPSQDCPTHLFVMWGLREEQPVNLFPSQPLLLPSFFEGLHPLNAHGADAALFSCVELLGAIVAQGRLSEGVPLNYFFQKTPVCEAQITVAAAAAPAAPLRRDPREEEVRCSRSGGSFVLYAVSLEWLPPAV